MRASVIGGLVLVGLAASGCQGSSVEEVATEFFVDCMAERGVDVEDVDVGVAQGRHIERFEWNSSHAEADDVGAECEQRTLDRFEIRRT